MSKSIVSWLDLTFGDRNVGVKPLDLNQFWDFQMPKNFAIDAKRALYPFSGKGIEYDIDPQIMGIKGANLAHMAALGLPVPPGFVISAELGAEIVRTEEEIGQEIAAAIKAAIGDVEYALSREFGGTKSPLLVSVRSGAAVSLPGMMDTVLNLGLNDETVLALEAETGDARFAWDSYRRFIQGYAQVVLGMDPDDFEDILDEMRERNHVNADSDLPASALQEVTKAFLVVVEQQQETPFPQSVYDQLHQALLAVFHSWNTDRAIRYRDIQNIPHEGGTAAVIQAMVFGNRDKKSCTGVYFTRNPSTGERRPYGEYMQNAQGEDVVSGFRTPMELTEDARMRAFSENPSMEKYLPDCFENLLKTGGLLEENFSDMQEIEFTVESNKLYLLQTRTGKRTPKAGLRIAVEMAQEGLIPKKEAVARNRLSELEAMSVSKIVPPADAKMITKGLPASPGAATGKIVFSSQDAVDQQAKGEDVILVRSETDPKDVHGMIAAKGILTSRGGMTSHAAVVARGMAKPCITAAMGLKIDVENQTCSSVGNVMQAGDIITMDGGSGQVFLGTLPVTVPEPEGDLATILSWQENLSKGD